eukprot:m.453249 g.453249  ORF g.453249 m.453249 type:complete len:333 (+) comp21549_c0_seq3:1973-2971(+)
MEMSATPERCLDACDVLRTTYADMGHLLHMPSHIDMQTGNYNAAVECNRRACVADLKLAVRTGHHTNYHGYLCHNFHMLTWAAMFDGQFSVALQAAKDTYAHTPAEMLRDFADYLEPYAAGEWHVLIRFGKWDTILAKALPSAAATAQPSPVATATAHYARALAQAIKGNITAAEHEQQCFAQSYDRVPASFMLHTVPSRSSLAVAEAMLSGELNYARGNYSTAFDDLRRGVLLEEALPYDEPWGWMQPVRHALGALLLEQGRICEAEEVYTQDLKKYPKNLWSLHGLAECLSQTAPDKASLLQEEYRLASERLEISLPGSCLCRKRSTARM